MTNMLLAATLAVSMTDFSATTPEMLVDAARAHLATLGTYRMRFTKEERVRGAWHGPQVMDLVVRERPFAVRGDIVRGPHKGRRFLYDETQRKTDLRLREAGMLGVVPLWIGVDNALTRQDTRHPITALGYGFVFDLIERDRKRATFGVVDEGMSGGSRCLMLTAPAGVSGLYGERIRLCIDPKALLITSVEVWDAQGRLEKLGFELLEAKAEHSFALDDNGL